MTVDTRPRKRAAVADPEARKFLRNADPVLAQLIDARPGFRSRAWPDELQPLGAFGTLIFQVAVQQLSVAATRRIVSRLQDSFGGHLPSPAELLAADPEVLRASGLSYRKGATLRALAERFVDGRLSDEALARMTDHEVEAALTEVPGIGPWTAHGFLLVALDRPDVFLAGDIALRRAIQRPTGSTTFRARPSWPSSRDAGDRTGAWPLPTCSRPEYEVSPADPTTTREERAST
jgi:DNA-3-methyladenine glycosylase II